MPASPFPQALGSEAAQSPTPRKDTENPEEDPEGWKAEMEGALCPAWRDGLREPGPLAFPSPTPS